MSEHITSVPPPLPPADPPRFRGCAWLAWVVIALAVAFEVVAPAVRSKDDEPTIKELAAQRLLGVQGRMLVGMHNLFGGQLRFSSADMAMLNTGPIRQRLIHIAVLGETAGPAEALEALNRLQFKAEDRQVAFSGEEQEAMDSLRKLYGDLEKERPDLPSLTSKNRALLRKELGWAGELALVAGKDADAPPRAEVLMPIRRSAGIALTYFVFLGGMGLVGLLVLGLILVLAATKNLNRGLRGGPTRNGGIYAEAFALWMVLHILLGFLSVLLPSSAPRLAVLLGADVVLLVSALVWPLLRGVSWQELRRDTGMNLGRHPLLEPLFGVLCFASAIPFLFVSIFLRVMLTKLRDRVTGFLPEDHFGQPDIPAHPIVELLARPDWSLRFQIFLLACVGAPLIEELLFRGMLFRQLREATTRWGRATSFLASAILVSFVFAVIHPQGILEVPALMALAFAFAIFREWRGSLVAAMIAHGIQNFMSLCMGIVFMG